MTDHAVAMESRRAPDWSASVTLVLVAVIALAAAWFLPWWAMEARAPQYGQRVLVVSVSPRVVAGDVFEVDTLGHYVGIRPMKSLAGVERSIAPFGLGAAMAGIALAPWLRRRALRFLCVIPALVMPAAFMADLAYWMDRTVNERDPDAALNLTVSSIDARILGEYAVGQFQITAKAESGLYLATVAGLLALGLAFSHPLVRGGAPSRAAAVGKAALLLLAALPASRAGAAERRLGAGQSIAAAVAAASPGDTIRIPAGVHRERLVIDKTLHLVGESGAVIDGGGEGTVLTVTAPGVEIRGLVIRGSGLSYTSEDSGIRLMDAVDARIVDSRIEDALFGLYAVRAHRARLENSVVVGKAIEPERRGDGIRLFQSNDCQILRNRVEHSRDVIIWYSSGTRVEDNVVRHGRYGLHYMYSDNNIFRGNRFEDDQVGASIMYSRGIELRENSFSFANGPGAYGLLIKEANDIFIHENRFIGNATALFLDDAPQARDARVEVRRNLIARNDVGVAMQPLTRRVEFSENAFLGNRTPVAVIGNGNADGCVWSVGGRGNYWSEAVAFDRDGDGVSELPFRLDATFEVLADRHPVLGFYRDTPAAEAIDLAARWFPLFAARPQLTDPHPLVHAPIAAWMKEPEGHGRGPALLGAGAGLFGVALLGIAGARRVIA